MRDALRAGEELLLAVDVFVVDTTAAAAAAAATTDACFAWSFS